MVFLKKLHSGIKNKFEVIGLVAIKNKFEVIGLAAIKNKFEVIGLAATNLEGTFLNKTRTIQPFPKENPRGRFILETCKLEAKKVEALKRSAIVLEMLQNEKNT